jgi:RNA polymerase sigma factor (sigma-70 family)
MATSQMSEVIQHLRRTVLLHDGAGLTAGQLLEDYISRRDEAALAALVQRHGPMVWGVCRRVLRHHHDAEDAFQATFLVLVRKAASIVPRQMVANWLYGVAHQTALNARAAAAKRKRRERQVTEMPEPAVTEQDLWHDLQPILDEELSRLPDKYRSVVILCDLEGKTRKEAARQIGVPDGTVAGWLARARVRLAKRLAQRGVVLSGGALAAVLSQNGASAAVPTSVVSSTIRAASLYAAGQGAATGAISVKVVALTEGVMKAVFLSKLKSVSVVLLVVAAQIGALSMIYQSQAADQQKAQRATENSDNTEKQPVANKKDKKDKSDEEQLQGTWKIVSTIDCGEEVKEVGEWTFQEMKIKTMTQRNGRKLWGRIRFQINSRAKPKEIDMVAEGVGDDDSLLKLASSGWEMDKRFFNEQRMQGIYALEGDTLKICISRKSEERPTAFQEGLLSIRMTFQKVNPKEKEKKGDEPARQEQRPKQAKIAWGKATEGLEAGIAFRKGEPDTYLPGQSVNLEIYLRNTSDQKTSVSHIETLFEEWLPNVADTDGKTYKVVNGPLNLGQASIVTRTLNKGETIRLGTAWFVILPSGTKGEASASTLIAPPGKYLVRLNGFPLRRAGNDSDEQKWSTGPIELDIGAAK